MESNNPISDLKALAFDRKKRIWKPFMKKYKCDIICEIGVRRGDNFKKMIEHNPFIAVAVDSWYEDTNIARNDVGHTQEELNEQYDKFKEEMYKYPYVTVNRAYSFVAVNKFDDNFFDLVYIDGDHTYNGCLRDIAEWYPKVKKGGFLLGDDFVEWKNRLGVKFGVIEAVKKFASDNNLEFFTLPRYGWGMIKK